MSVTSARSANWPLWGHMFWLAVTAVFAAAVFLFDPLMQFRVWAPALAILGVWRLFAGFFDGSQQSLAREGFAEESGFRWFVLAALLHPDPDVRLTHQYLLLSALDLVVGVAALVVLIYRVVGSFLTLSPWFVAAALGVEVGLTLIWLLRDFTRRGSIGRAVSVHGANCRCWSCVSQTSSRGHN